MTTARNNRLQLIQLSRALVPIMVMTFHLSESMYAYYEYDFFSLHALPLSGGVNFFFALSGFMMFYLYKNKYSVKSEWKPFILNRMIRIYPLYWTMTIIYLSLWFLLPGYVWIDDSFSAQTLLTSLFLIPVPNQSDPFLIVAWSLIFTLFFYLMFSFSFLLSKSSLALFFGTWAFLSVIFNTGLIDLNFFPIHFLFSLSSLIFLGGMLAGYIVSRTVLTLRASALFILTGLMLFPFTWTNYLNEWIYIDFDFITGFASFLLITGLASVDLQKVIPIPPFLSMLGNAAFAMYLFHNTILDLTMEYFYRVSLADAIGFEGIMILITLLMLASGIFAYYVIEQPLVKMLHSMIVKPQKKTVDHPPTAPRTA